MPTEKQVYSTAIISKRTKLVLGKDAFIGDFCLVTVPTLVLGDGAQVNSGTRIVGQSPVQIGENSTVSYGCSIITASDSTEAEFMNDATPATKRIIRTAPIGIGNKCFVGAHSILMPGVTLAEGVVVRAFSYVNKQVTVPHTVWGGQPAELVGQRKYVEFDPVLNRLEHA